VTLYFLNNVLGLYLSFEPPQRVFEGFTLLKSNFRQRTTPPRSSYVDQLVMASNVPLSQVDCAEIFTDLKNPIALKTASVAEQTRSTVSSSLQVADNTPDKTILPILESSCT